MKRGRDIAKSINSEILVENHKVKVQCSIGCSFNSDLEEITSSVNISVDEWLKLADIAMYESKKSRKGEVVLFDHKLYRRQIDIKNCVEHLHRVINDDLGSIVFQPIYRRGRIESIEALGRVGDKEKSICLSIGEAIDIASSNGIKYQLFKYLFDLGFKSYKDVIDGIEDPPDLNINLPIELLSSGDFVHDTKDIFKKLNISPKNIYLEITERALESDISTVKKNILELKSMGCRFSIDDFGTGYSSIRRLIEFEFDQMKVDRSLIYHVYNSEKMQIALSSTVKLGQSLGMEVLGEGVEDESELGFLEECKIDLVQGFYFSRPTSMQNIRNILLKERIVSG